MPSSALRVTSRAGRKRTGGSSGYWTACVMVNGLYGYIDRRGRYLVEPEFDYARSKRDGRAYVERDGRGSEILI